MTNAETAPATDVNPFFRLQKAVIKHKITIVMGAALAASLALNVLQSMTPEGTTKYFLTPEDVGYLNDLMDEDQKSE